ncbi:hypothetical protein [Bacillus sp. BP-3]|uniref:hypothetical protein n=1 Tax=Bacillus sp. BP-3 TaxID=3022773 RepID=UPI00233105C9|nr:hypothetical protein [Bacillus sp. BP-3]MDC2866489.1 hypothetical protein [Bacillus sp. BP-3]
MDYQQIKMKTLEGKKISRLKSYIAETKSVLKNSLHINSLIKNNQKNSEREIRYYAINSCLTKLNHYIDLNFEIAGLSEEEINKNVFSGEKVVSVLKFIDFSIANNKINMKTLKDREFCIFSDVEHTNLFLLQAKHEMLVYGDIKTWIINSLSYKEYI